MRFALVLMLALAAAAGAAAQERRLLAEDEARAFRAVGRLNVAGSRFCTATLIEADLVLTAAHCLFHPRTMRRVPLEELRFVPAQRIDANAGVWNVAQAAIGAGFAPSEAPAPAELRTDVALLRLEGAVPAEAATPFGLGTLSPSDPPTSIVSYARDRAQAPSIQEACVTMGAIGEVLVLDCPVERGVSGAPVFLGAGEETRLVAVVSATANMPSGEEYALAVLVAPWIETLRGELSAEGDAAEDGEDADAAPEAEGDDGAEP